MSKTRVDRWWDTYNAALTGLAATPDPADFDRDEAACACAQNMATLSHGTLAELARYQDRCRELELRCDHIRAVLR